MVKVKVKEGRLIRIPEDRRKKRGLRREDKEPTKHKSLLETREIPENPKTKKTRKKWEKDMHIFCTLWIPDLVDSVVTFCFFFFLVRPFSYFLEYFF